ncbi:MAG: dual specificity protein phosphatase family protein [Nitrospiraceae bacterium]
MALRSSFLRRVAYRVSVGIVLFGIATSAFGYYRWEQRNFDVVAADQVYRARQLSSDELSTVVARYGIKSILNLRGKNPGETWYRAESAVADLLGVQLVSFPLSANLEWDSEQISDVVRVLREAPKPLLIHCKSGSDRTGLAAALYLLEVEGQSASVASHQLSLYYGHIPALLGTSTSAMDRTFWRVTERRDSSTARSSHIPPSPSF